MFQGRGAELSYRLAEIVRGLTSDCRRCGGDGVLIDDNPESTQQIVTTCHECAGRGYEGLSVETAETAREER
jgi:DnaJ-class molecular chaperone